MSLPNYYEILSLSIPPAAAALEPEKVRAAYRRALLAHHPDKTTSKPAKQAGATVSVDDITLAYQTLSDLQKKTEYDRSLRLGSGGVPTKQASAAERHAGLEVVDLDDMTFDKNKSAWSRSCRCGNEKGFMLKEEDLEMALGSPDAGLIKGHGDIVVECTGCTLSLKVEFVATYQW